MTFRRRGRKALGILALVALGMVLLVRTERAGEWVCGELRARLPAALGAQVAIGECHLDPLSLSARLRSISVTPMGESAPALEADEASASLASLFPGGVGLGRLSLVRPRAVIRPSGGGGCFLDALKRVRVGLLEVTGGRLVVHLGDGRELLLEGVDAEASIGRDGARFEVAARSGTAKISASTAAALGRTSVEGSLELAEQVVELRRAEVNLEGITANATGLVEALCDERPKLGLTAQVYLPLAALPRLGLEVDQPAGQVWSRVSLTGTPAAPVVRAEVQATQVVVGEFTPGDFAARLAIADRLLTIEEFSTRSGEGSLKVSGEIALRGGYPVRLTVESREASLARVLERCSVKGSWVEFPATVKGVVSGHLSPTPALSGDIDFHTGRFVLAARAYDAPKSAGRTILTFGRAQGSFRLRVSDEAVTFESIDMRAGEGGGTHVTGSVKLNYDDRRGLDIRAHADTLDVSEFGHIAELPWQGLGSAKVAVVGPYSDVVVDGSATLRDFKLDGYSLGVVQTPVRYVTDTLTFPSVVAQKGQSQYFGSVELAFLNSGVFARAAAQLPEGRLEDMVDLLADLSPTIANLQGSLTGRVSAVAGVDSLVSDLTGVVALQAREVEFFERQLGAGSALLRFDRGESLVLTPTTLHGPLGRLSADGRWSFAGPLDFRVQLDDGSLAALVDPRGASAIPIGGRFVAHAKVGGDTDVVQVDGAVSSGEVTWKARSLGPMRLSLRELGREVSVEGAAFAGVSGRMDFTARGEWPYSAKLQVDVPDLGPLLPGSIDAAVAATGTVTSSGALKALGFSKGTAQFSKLTLTRGEVMARGVGPVEFGWKGGGWEVRSLTLKGPTTEFQAAGTWGPPLVDLRTQGSIDLRLLGSVLPQLERTSGRLDFVAAFAGPVSAPTLVGRADLRDARASLRGQDLTLKALSGWADFSEARILIHDLEGFLNDGRLRGRGDLRLAGLRAKTVEVQLDIEDVSMQLRPDLTPRLTGSLLLSSRNGTSQLAGNLDVVKLVYTQSLSLESLLASARSRAVPSADETDDWLKLDVDVVSNGDVRIENNLARARLTGKLKVAGTTGRPVLIGAVEAGEGAQAYFRGNSYNVSRAQLQFHGLWPSFDLSATTQVREYLVSVKAFGKFDAPHLSLTAEPALPEADVFSLLTVGVTTRDKFASQSGLGLAGEAFLSASGLDQQVSRFLSRRVGLKDNQFRLTTTYNEASGTAEPAFSWESKLTDRLRLGVTQPVTGRGTRAQVEYRFSKNVFARGQWDNQASSDNLGVDLRFRFEWE